MKQHCPVIAVVDDDQRVRESLGELLESAGYAVKLFESAEVFLRSDAAQAVDALICDIRMPGMDGIELQRRVGSTHPQLPVILITARSDVSLLGDRAPNNRAIFRKPVDATELLRVIEQAVRKVP